MNLETTQKVTHLLNYKYFNFQRYYDLIVEPPERQEKILRLCESYPQLHGNLISPRKLSFHPVMTRDALVNRRLEITTVLSTAELDARNFDKETCMQLAQKIVSKQRHLIEHVEWILDCTYEMTSEQLLQFTEIIEPIITGEFLTHATNLILFEQDKVFSIKRTMHFQDLIYITTVHPGLKFLVHEFGLPLAEHSAKSKSQEDGRKSSILHDAIKFYREAALSPSTLSNIFIIASLAGIPPENIIEALSSVKEDFLQIKWSPALALAFYQAVPPAVLRSIGSMGLLDHLERALAAHPEIFPAEVIFQIEARYSKWRCDFTYMLELKRLVICGSLQHQLLPKMSDQQLMDLLLDWTDKRPKENGKLSSNMRLPYPVTLFSGQVVILVTDLYVYFARFATNTPEFLAILGKTGPEIPVMPEYLNRWIIFLHSWSYVIFRRAKISLSGLLDTIADEIPVCKFMDFMTLVPTKGSFEMPPRTFKAQIERVCNDRGLTVFRDFGTLRRLLEH
jgi:hypothetical protein